jgi:hypothetical protein
MNSRLARQRTDDCLHSMSPVSSNELGTGIDLAEIHTTGPYLVDDFGRGDPTTLDRNCTQAVLKAYTTAMQRSLDERSAFEAATLAYRARNRDVSEIAARRAAASIICGKPL